MIEVTRLALLIILRRIASVAVPAAEERLRRQTGRDRLPASIGTRLPDTDSKAGR